MKKILILVVLIGAVVWLIIRYGTPETTTPPASEGLGADTTESIAGDLNALDIGDTDADLNALDADVNSL